MDDLPPNVLDLPLHVRALMALRRAVAMEIEDHRRTGHPVVVWRDGQVVLVPAEELLPLPPSQIPTDLPTPPASAPATGSAVAPHGAD